MPSIRRIEYCEACGEMSNGPFQHCERHGDMYCIDCDCPECAHELLKEEDAHENSNTDT